MRIKQLIAVFIGATAIGTVTIYSNSKPVMAYADAIASSNKNNDNNNDDNDDNTNGQGDREPGVIGGNNQGGAIGGDVGAGGATTGGTTAGATVTSGVGAGTTATNPQDVRGYNYANGERVKSGNQALNTGDNVSNPQNYGKNSNTNATEKAKGQQNSTIKNANYHRFMTQIKSNSKKYVPTASGLTEKTSKNRRKNEKKISPSLKKGLAYLNKYAHKTNPKYPRFTDDCTSFASQYMKARGYKETSKKGAKEKVHLKSTYSKNTKKWFFYKKKHVFGLVTRVHHTTSWSTVNGFWKYWVGHKKLGHFTTSSKKVVRKKANLGDIIQFYSKARGWFHTVIVSKKNKKDIYYASHTSDYAHKRLKNVNRNLIGSKVVKYRVIHVRRTHK